MGASGEDPLTSEFKPRQKLVFVRAPKSRHELRYSFSGTELELAEPGELALGSSNWPDSGTYCDVPWDDLEARFAKS